MLKVLEIEKLFDYSTEKKDTKEEQLEKNNRRIESICMKVPEVRYKIYESRKGVIDSIQMVNEEYSLILSQDNVESVIKELKAFNAIISNSHIDLNTKACVITSFNFKEYKKLLRTCKFTGLKSIDRLTNMKTLADKYLHGIFNKKYYLNDMKEQVVFFNDLIVKYENISTDNFYVYVLRYDLKTIKKRNPRISTKRITLK